MREWNYAQATKLHLLWKSDYKKQFLRLATVFLKLSVTKLLTGWVKRIFQGHTLMYLLFFGKDLCNQIKTLYGSRFIVLNLAQQANTFCLNVRKAFS